MFELWVENLNLSLIDKDTINSQKMLDDKIINAAQILMKAQNQQIDGLVSTLIGETNGFQASSKQSVQIHFDSNRQHWVTSSTMRNRIELADSLYNGSISESIVSQLKQRYVNFAEKQQITVYVLPTQRQVNGIDCGCHAIATAVEFLSEDGDPLATFDVGSMRAHLAKCLEDRYMSPFPRCLKKKRGRKPNVTAVNIMM